MEKEIKGDKQGLLLAKRRKRKLVAQEMVVLAGLAHNVLIWSRRWLSQGEERLGQLGIATHEPDPVTRTDTKRGIKLSRGSALRSGLIKKGYLRMHRLVIGQGGQAMAPEITERGLELLARWKVKVREMAGRGGFVHRLVQWAIWKSCLNSFPGCTAEIEKGIEDG